MQIFKLLLMNRIFKLFTCAAFIAVSSLAVAQTQDGVTAGKKDKATEITNTLTRRLTLTEEQRPKVQQMASEYVRQLDQLRADEKTFNDKKKILDANYQAKVKELLTDTQKAEFDVLINEQKK